MNGRAPAYSLLLLVCAIPARADVWIDPSLREALAKADLVVRARAPKEGPLGETTITFRVERTIKGKARKTVAVSGLHDSTRTAAPAFAPNAEVILILSRTKNGYRVPTPTMGRYPVRDGVVKYATLRDTHLRLDLPPRDFETFIALHEGREDAEWLGSLRATLEGGAPSDQGADLAQRYLALEALALKGRPDDAPRITKYLSQLAPFQLRVSACRALAGALGKAAAGRLLKVARTDAESAVRTAAIGALGRLSPPPSGLVTKLAELLPGATGDTVRFSGPNDPRLNKWPAPKTALLRVITRHGAKPVKQDVLRVVAEYRGSNAEVFTAALEALISLEADPKVPSQLVRCFRAESEVSSGVYNKEICAALQIITGKKLGNDPAKWRSWVEQR